MALEALEEGTGLRNRLEVSASSNGSGQREVSLGPRRDSVTKALPGGQGGWGGAWLCGRPGTALPLWHGAWATALTGPVLTYLFLGKGLWKRSSEASSPLPLGLWWCF